MHADDELYQSIIGGISYRKFLFTTPNIPDTTAQRVAHVYGTGHRRDEKGPDGVERCV